MTDRLTPAERLAIVVGFAKTYEADALRAELRAAAADAAGNDEQAQREREVQSASEAAQAAMESRLSSEVAALEAEGRTVTFTDDSVQVSGPAQ